MKKTFNILVVAMALMMALASSRASAVQVQDIARLKGSEGAKLVGMGLVFGLPGTGDGGKFLPAMRALTEVVRSLIDPNTMPFELKDAKNVALVALSATVPDSGIREGDTIDVHVSAITAKSLAGGRLFLIPLTGPIPQSPVYAFAEGLIEIEDRNAPTVGVIRAGARMTRDVRTRFLDEQGRLTLVLQGENANWTVANNVANLINGVLSPDGPNIAKAVDQKNVVIAVPGYERTDPAPFISQVLQSYIDPAQLGGGAKVKINEKKKSIAMDSDVQISPVIVTIAGLTITTITPEATPTPQAPKVDRNNFIAIDPERRGGAKLAALLDALNRLKVSDEDRITVIKELHKMGKLHAQLILE